MRVFPQELFIRKLQGRVPKVRQLDWLREMSREACIAELRKFSGLDLGDDTAAWEKWWLAEKEKLAIDEEF